MDFGIANLDTDAVVKKKAMDYIIREVCYRFKTKQDATFTIEDIQKILQGLGPEYIRLNIRHLFLGSDLFTISDEKLELTLTEKGIRHCKDYYQ